MIMRIGVVLGAVVASIAVFLIVYNLLSDNDSQIADFQPPIIQPPSLPTEEVLVVTKDYAPGELIEAEFLQWRQWPEDSVAPQYYARQDAPDAVERLIEGGARARIPLTIGEPIADGNIITLESGFLSIEIAPGKLALSIETLDATRVGGFVLPGDYVDVVMTRFLEDVNVSTTILTGLKVLAIGPAAAAESANIPAPNTVSLEVWPWQAERLALAAREGELTLGLRSLEDVQEIAANDTGVPQDIDEFIDEIDEDTATRAFRGNRPEFSEEVEPPPFPVVYQ